MKLQKTQESDAIHPGYGFLSENPVFAKRCEEEGIVFIGPPSHVIAEMGSKIRARNLMMKAGVPVVPGTKDAVEDVDEALKVAEEIGYPVLIKASAGGGGIGMKVVHSREELRHCTQFYQTNGWLSFWGLFGFY